MRKARVISVVTAVIAVLTLAGGALACQVEGWALSEVMTRAVVVVEADVVTERAAGGYDIRVLRVLKGDDVGASMAIGTVPSDIGGDCGGQVALGRRDHVLLALADPETALAIETAVWWIQPDGVIERSNLVSNTGPTTFDAVLAGLRTSVPDTATVAQTTAARDDGRALLIVGAWAVGLVLAMLRMRRVHTARL